MATAQPTTRDLQQSDRLKVVLVSSQDGYQGGERQMALLADGLRDRGHELVVFARAGGLLADRLSEDGFRVVTFSGRGRSPRSLLSMRRSLAAFRPHVLHYNDSHAMTSAGVAALGLSIPLRIASRRVDFPLRSIHHFQMLANRILCVSNAVRRACLTAGIADQRLHVVHDGVNPNPLMKANAQLARDELRLDGKRKVLLSIASLTDCKGHRYLIQAMSDIIAKRQDVILLCAGEGALRKSLEEECRRRNLSDHVRFLGFRDDTPNLIAAADMLVVSSHTEGLCSSIIDAMMIGCPVVSSDAGGIPDLLLADGRPTGWLVPARDATALSSSVLAALEEREERSVRVTRARANALQNFTQDRMVDNTIDVYRDLAATPIPKSA